MTTLTVMILLSTGTAAPAQPPFPEVRVPVQQVRPDMVIKWNEIALHAIRKDRSPPLVAARSLAIMHTAIYDAVMAIERTHQPYLVDATAAPGASAEAAAAAAAHRTLVAVYPKQREFFDLAYNWAGLPRDHAHEQGAALGRFVADRILESRRDDRADKSGTRFPVKSTPGKWQPTPPAFHDALLPGWGDVKPFAILPGTQHRPPGPPALTSRTYTDAFNEVKYLGGRDSSHRTKEQTQIAHFWADDLGTTTPPGHWNKIAQTICLERGNSLAENARVFAHLNICMADTSILCWVIKFSFEYWRPVSGIHHADLDGNPDTSKDPNWMPLLTTPPFPAYTSGHSTFSGAAATSLAYSFGTYDVRFTSTSDSLPGVTRSFKNLWSAAEEAGMSRIYGGIHWQFDNTDGLKVGQVLGTYVARHTLQPRPHQVLAPVHAAEPPPVIWEFPGNGRRLRIGNR